MTWEGIQPGTALLRIRLQAGRNRFRLTRRRHPFRVVLLFVAFAPLAIAFTAFLAYGVSSSFAQAADRSDQTAILASFLVLFMIGGFIGVSTAALQALYLAEDVPFMMTMPIPLRVIYASKMIDAATGALPASILAVGALAGFAIENWFDPVVMIAASLVFLSTLALTSALSVTFVSVITRFVPPKRARMYLLLTAFVLVILSAATWPLVAPHQTSTGHESSGLEFARSLIARTPPGWSARSLQAVATGSMSAALAWLAIAFGAALVCIWMSYEAFRRVYVGSLDRAIDAPSQGAARFGSNRLISLMVRPIPEPLRGLAMKEWLSFVRDVRRLTGVVWPVLLVLVYTVILGRRSGSSDLSPQLRFWVSNGSLALLPWGISLGVSIYAFGSEGRSIALIRSLPLSARQIFTAKLLSSMIPIACASVVVAAAALATRGANPTQIAEMLALVLWMAIGYVTIDTAASAVAPNFEILQIQRAIGLTGRAFGLVTGAGFGLMTAVGLARLLFLAHGTPSTLESSLGSSIAANNAWGLLFAGAAFAVAAGTVALAALIGVRRVESILETG